MQTITCLTVKDIDVRKVGYNFEIRIDESHSINFTDEALQKLVDLYEDLKEV